MSIKKKEYIRPHNSRKILYVLIIFTVGIFSGALLERQLLFKQYNLDNQNGKIEYEKRIGDYSHLTNPLLECEQFSVGDRELGLVKYKILAYIKEKTNKKEIKDVSVYIRDLNNGPWVGINEKEYFTPSSLLKIPIMIAYFKIAETNPEILDKVILYTKSVSEKYQSIKPKETIQIGRMYTVNELLYKMIVYSDNESAYLLIFNINKDDLNRVYTDLNLTIPGFNSKDDFISVKDYTSFFRILYNASYLSRTMSERALKILTEVDFKDGLLVGLPSSIKVAHKFGENTDSSGLIQLHECGIVYYDKSPYLIGIMTRGYDFDKSKNIIRDISKIVYDNKESHKN